MMVVGTSREYLNVTTEGWELTKRLLTQTQVNVLRHLIFFLCFARGKKKLEHQLT